MTATHAAAVGDTHVQRSLAAPERAEVRRVLVQPDRQQQAFHEAGRLPQRHAKEHLYRQASLGRGTAEALLATASPGRRRDLFHISIKPDRQ